MLFTVSTKVSPFFTEDEEDEKLITSAESLFSANSKESLVLVEFSKEILPLLMSFSKILQEQDFPLN